MYNKKEINDKLVEALYMLEAYLPEEEHKQPVVLDWISSALQFLGCNEESAKRYVDAICHPCSVYEHPGNIIGKACQDKGVLNVPRSDALRCVAVSESLEEPAFWCPICEQPYYSDGMLPVDSGANCLFCCREIDLDSPICSDCVPQSEPVVFGECLERYDFWDM